MKLKRKLTFDLGCCAAARCRRKTGLRQYVHPDKGAVPLCEAHAEESGLPEVDNTLVDVLEVEPVTTLVVDENADTQTQLQTEAAQAEEALAFITEEMTIETAEDADFAAEVLADAKGHYKRLEAKRKKATQPMNEAMKEIRGWFKPATDFYVDCERAIKRKLAAYHEEQERNRLQALREAQEAAQSGTSDEVVDAIAKLDDAEEPEVKGLTYRTIYKFEVESVGDVPRPFMMPNEKAIGIYVARHREDAEIPGVRIFPETIVSSRSAT